jgi:hypothetical protein
MTDTATRVRASLEAMLRELLDGPAPDNAFVLNRGDRGLRASLDALSAEAASARPEGRSSVAAHVDHVRYGFELLNRAAQGENPWSDADYSASWERQRVTDAQWRSLRQALADQTAAWRSACMTSREWDQAEMTGALASAVHLAYHVGAIRQISQSTSGPKATD